MPPESEMYVCDLPHDIQAMAAAELNETPKTREESIRIIREWISRQPHLNARTDTQTILRYLRGCKFSLEKTKQKIEMYYTCKGALPEMFTGRDPLHETFRAIYDLQLMVPLPGYDSQGRKVILGRLGAWNPSKHRPEDLFRAASMLFDVLFMEDEQMSVTGFVQVHDMAGITLKHAAALNISLVKKVMTVWTEGYSTRPKAVHYINTNTAFNTVFNLFSPFMKEKMKKRVMVHGGKGEALFKHVPKTMLPIEYGGSSGTLTELTDSWINKLTGYRGWFKEDEKYKVDESKRPGKPRTKNDLFGIDGSFRKLEID